MRLVPCCTVATALTVAMVASRYDGVAGWLLVVAACALALLAVSFAADPANRSSASDASVRETLDSYAAVIKRLRRERDEARDELERRERAP